MVGRYFFLGFRNVLVFLFAIKVVGSAAWYLYDHCDYFSGKYALLKEGSQNCCDNLWPVDNDYLSSVKKVSIYRASWLSGQKQKKTCWGYLEVKRSQDPGSPHAFSSCSELSPTDYEFMKHFSPDMPLWTWKWLFSEDSGTHRFGSSHLPRLMKTTANICQLESRDLTTRPISLPVVTLRDMPDSTWMAVLWMPGKPMLLVTGCKSTWDRSLLCSQSVKRQLSSKIVTDSWNANCLCAAFKCKCFHQGTQGAEETAGSTSKIVMNQYKISTSTDGSNFVIYQHSGSDRIFSGDRQFHGLCCPFFVGNPLCKMAFVVRSLAVYSILALHFVQVTQQLIGTRLSQTIWKRPLLQDMCDWSRNQLWTVDAWVLEWRLVWNSTLFVSSETLTAESSFHKSDSDTCSHTCGKVPRQ